MRVDLGVIKSINLPDSFAKGEVSFGSIRQNWRKTFHPREKKDREGVAITFMFRGGPTQQSDGKAFRKLLSEPPGLIFSSEKNIDSKSHSQSADIISVLADALGNAGNNQLTNTATGIGGPSFYLQSMEILELSKKNVLAVCGFFHNSSMTPQNFYFGLFVDARPEQEECVIEELIFEAQTNDLYEKYRGSFKKALTTIEWN